MHTGALALIVGGVWSAEVGTFVPIDVEPAQIFEGSLGVLGPAAVGVKILHPKDQNATPLSGPLPGAMKGVGVSDVEVAGGRGSDPAAISIGRHCQKQCRDTGWGLGKRGIREEMRHLDASRFRHQGRQVRNTNCDEL
jgi:hypothetical protein